MKNRITKCVALIAVLCALAMTFAVPLASAASYSKVYGETQDKLRVRESASTNAAVIDNIVKGACVYVTSSKESGGCTFVRVNYRSEDGDIESGWICQKDGSDTYVKILSATQAQSEFKVSGGNLPSKRVGTYTDSQRARSAGSTNDNEAYIREGSTGSKVKDIQTKLKGLGYYTGELTGNAGDKTVSAIKKFQSRYNLTADGIAGPSTIAKIDAVYADKGGSATSTTSGLKLNDSGSDVRDLQSDLTTLGYYWAEITGNFGSKTEAAVKSFQKKNGLSADGVAGAKTLNAIAAAVGRAGGSSASSVTGTLKLNSKGDAVAQMQTDLKALGYYTAEITGNFGSKTEAAVKAFQRKNGLSADGVAGSKTLDAIAAAAGRGSSSSTGTTLKRGSTGDKVRALQQDLTTLGFYYGDITGHYGDMTKAAVEKFQKSRGMTKDGVAGPTTIAAISSALGNSGALGVGSSSNSLREGDESDLVEDMQRRLKKLGYYTGDITGHFGEKTTKAVRKFQDDNDLYVDGIAGTKTLEKIYEETGDTYTGNIIDSNGAVVSTSRQYGKINADNVNLRRSYSTSSGAIKSMDKGEKIIITKTYSIGGVKWYYCYMESGDKTYSGYVHSNYVDILDDDEYNESDFDDIYVDGAETIGLIRVTGTKVHIREEDDKDSESLGYAYEGDVFYYIDKDGSWYQIRSGGWIHGDYVEILDEDEADDYLGDIEDDGPYKNGDTGYMVSWIQEALDELGYYDGKVTGHFGNKTEDAVRAFQNDYGLGRDGIVGGKTLAALREAYTGGSTDGSTGSALVKGDVIYSIDWFDYKSDLTSSSKFNIRKGATATLTYVKSNGSLGQSFDIKIQSVGNHIDAEPLTKADTQVLCSIYGVSSASQLSYKRRPFVLTTSTGLTALVSLYPEEHGDDTLPNNGYDGQFCLHMVDSKTHGSDKVDTDHQKCIDAAELALIEAGYAIASGYPARVSNTTGNKTETVTPLVPDVAIYPKMYVYVVDGWGEYHTDKDCAKFEAAGMDAAAVKAIRREYEDVKAGDNKACTTCESEWIYFGDTSKSNFHYVENCPNLLSYKYASLYRSTVESNDALSSSKKRTHVCNHCDEEGGTTPLPEPEPAKYEMDPATVVWSADGWGEYHTTDKCSAFGSMSSTDKNSYRKSFNNVKTAERNPCSKCGTKTVYYGKGTSSSYHYEDDCSVLTAVGYDTIYYTYEDYAKSKGRAHSCTGCSK